MLRMLTLVNVRDPTRSRFALRSVITSALGSTVEAEASAEGECSRWVMIALTSNKLKLRSNKCVRHRDFSSLLIVCNCFCS